MSNCGRTLLDHTSRFAQVTQPHRTYHLAKFMESIHNRLLKPVTSEDTSEPSHLRLLLLQYRIRIHMRIHIRTRISSLISHITSILT